MAVHVASSSAGLGVWGEGETARAAMAVKQAAPRAMVRRAGLWSVWVRGR